MFFGGGKKGGPAQKRKVQSTQLPLEITLENVYNGEIRKVPHKRIRVCEKCEGKGGEGVQRCVECNGQGGFIQMVQVGPGAYQQIQRKCEKCLG